MANKRDLKMTQCDIVVIGAGLVGLAVAIALTKQGKHVVLLDAKSNDGKLSSAWDTRVYALSPSTESWLRDLGVWSTIDTARVNDVDGMALWSPDLPSPLQLHASDANLTKLACIVENQQLMHALWQAVKALQIPVVMGSACQSILQGDELITVQLEDGCQISAKLLIAADGTDSYVRHQLDIATNEKNFNQTALVANYKAEMSHNDVARQWFRPRETLALLPLPEKSVSMVWAVPTHQAETLLSLSSEQLAGRVQAAADNVLGRLEPISKTLSFVLRQVTVREQVKARVVFVGDAAHQIHPMAGQGANLGLRDVMALETLIKSSHPLQDIGDKIFLRQFARARKADIISVNALTSGLDAMFAIDVTVFKKLATIGMRQLDKYASIKRFLIKQAVA